MPIDYINQVVAWLTKFKGKKTNQNPCSSKIIINNSEANKIKQSSIFISFLFITILMR